MPSNYWATGSGVWVDPENDSILASRIIRNIVGGGLGTPTARGTTSNRPTTILRYGSTGGGASATFQTPLDWNPVNTVECVGAGGQGASGAGASPRGGGGGGAYAVTQNVPNPGPTIQVTSPSSQSVQLSLAGPTIFGPPATPYCSAANGGPVTFSNVTGGAGGTAVFPTGNPGGNGSAVSGSSGGAGGGCGGPNGPGSAASGTTGGISNGGVPYSWGEVGTLVNGAPNNTAAQPPGGGIPLGGGSGGPDQGVGVASGFDAASGGVFITYVPLPVLRMMRATICA